MPLRASVLFLAILLCSCATTYVSPTVGDTATLSIVNYTNGIAYAMAFKNARDCSGGKQSLTPSGLPPHGRQSVTVAAGADFSFFITTPDSFAGGDSGRIVFKSCFVSITFTPKSGAAASRLGLIQALGCL